MADPNYKNSLKEFEKLYDEYKNDPVALSQMYKIMNYKPPSQISKNPLPPAEISEFLKSKNFSSEYDMYDDILYFDDNKIKEIMMKQTFLINKGYFDPKSYFPSLNVTNLDDNTFDKKILDMLNPTSGKNTETSFKYHH